MDIQKTDARSYTLSHDGYTIRVLNTGRGWAVIGDTPPMLMGKFVGIDAVAKAFTAYTVDARDKAAALKNPLIDSPEVDGKGTILDPNLRFGIPPTRRPPAVTPPTRIPF